jgi:hypothetical protein
MMGLMLTKDHWRGALFEKKGCRLRSTLRIPQIYKQLIKNRKLLILKEIIGYRQNFKIVSH